MRIIRKIRYYLSKIETSNFLIMAVIVIFALIMVFLYFREVKEQPIQNGFIMDSSKVETDIQGEMEVESLDKAFEQSKNDYNTQMISTLFFCINTAEINDNYDCLANIIDENARSEFLSSIDNDSDNTGHAIYEAITQERILSGIDNEIIKNEYEKSNFNLTFTFMDGTKDYYYMELEQGTINKLERR